ncbi:TPA: IclR family transcriptional regulator [Burkholderia cenocepacia]|nr:IclR family transcriptional regulator [Burkholderia cenocepacia]
MTTEKVTDRAGVDSRETGATTIAAVGRALDVLNFIADERGPVSFSHLISELKLPKASAHALLNTLVSYGFLRRSGDGPYRLGPHLVVLAESFLSGTDVTREFNGIWDEHKDSPEETVLLSVLSGGEALYLAARNSARPLGISFSVGMRLPACLSASGRAMLAFLPYEDVLVRYVDGFPSPLTAKSLRTMTALKRELAVTRERGYSVDIEGIREGVAAFGAPVFDSSGNVIAAVSVCVSKTVVEREGNDKHLRVAVEIARDLTKKLGGRVA